jgi:2'-5' RNA ligase
VITIRAFFAVDLAVEVIRRIAAAEAAARQSLAKAGWAVRWVPPACLHPVACYVGDVDEALPSVLRDALRPWAAAAVTTVVGARGLVASGAADEGRPVEIVVPLADETGAYDGLLASLRERLEDLGLHLPDPEPPRVVVGRVTGAGEGALADLLAPQREVDFHDSPTLGLTLYRSDKHVARGDYYRLWHLSLGKATPTSRDDEAAAFDDDSDVADEPGRGSPPPIAPDVAHDLDGEHEDAAPTDEAGAPASFEDDDPAAGTWLDEEADDA